jgi:beta-galactosidase
MLLLATLSFLAAISPIAIADEASSEIAAPLHAGVKAVWDVGKAFREKSATRERICLNGLWRWQPAELKSADVPAKSWGFFKVPGCWPGLGDYMQKDCQTLYPHASWKNQRLSEMTAAWQQREIAIPEDWSSRRVALSADYLNSFAAVYVDGKKAGELHFPGGEVELTPHVVPGKTHLLSLHIVAMPLKGVLLSYNDTNTAREVKGSVPRRGLCGDVFLVGTPAGPRVTDVKIDTSMRSGEIAFETALAELPADKEYTLLAKVTKEGKEVQEFTSSPFQAHDLRQGRFTFKGKWRPKELWDLHTPQNMFEVSLTLREREKPLDTSFRQRFGFREFWIDGRDFYLNGSRIHLSCVPLDNAQIGAAQASYEFAKESMRRLKSFGINFVYTHNYGCQPGDHLSFTEVLRAADDVGMLVAFSQPHFSHYEWQAPDADANNGYSRHGEYYVRLAQNHPAVVFYAMSHNATGYGEDMNPDMTDGLKDPRSPGELNYVKRPLRAEAIVHNLDPSRIVYHHSSGNLGSMHTANFYPNFVPVQEMSDWFRHWATKGVKPVFTCEYGAPFGWDWAMYRGWYKGERSFGSAKVPWDFSLSEWNSQFFGDRAFQSSEPEKRNIRWEAKQFEAEKLWNRWDYPHDLNSTLFTEREPVFALYIQDNWRAFRTWGVSAISPWEHHAFWKLKPGTDRSRKELPVDWDNLQRPGFSADYLDRQYERMDLAYEQNDWEPTEAAKALFRNNMPLLGYIAGKRNAFTSKDHNFRSGEMIEKQAIVINNSREPVTCVVNWPGGEQRLEIPPGEQARHPIRLRVGPDVKVTFQFSTGEVQEDRFPIHVVQPQPGQVETRVALFDPRGETAKTLQMLGIGFRSVDAHSDLAGIRILLIGKSALSLTSPVPDISRVKDGLKVVLFEQPAEVLEQRFGFRVAEYGLRNVFPRVPDHPLLAGLKEEHLRDWRGEATLQPPQLKYELKPRLGPTVKWCGIEVPHLWRCGNRGNVASVLIEKPARGDFLPIVDGGYSLQYSPLMEYREGKGMVLFCQLDVSGRTESDPAAETIVHNIMKHVSGWKPSASRSAVYVGIDSGKRHLESAGFTLQPYEAKKIGLDNVLIVASGEGKTLAADAPKIADWLKLGGHVLGIGLDQADAEIFIPASPQMKRAEHIAAFFEPPAAGSFLQGIGPADVHNRDPREIPLITGGAKVIGDGVLATDDQIVFCQLVPWQFSELTHPNVKKTFRRSSYTLTRLLSNLGVPSKTPILERFAAPVSVDKPERRWERGLYLDQPEEWDDPYRHFRW